MVEISYFTSVLLLIFVLFIVVVNSKRYFKIKRLESETRETMAVRDNLLSQKSIDNNKIKDLKETLNYCLKLFAVQKMYAESFSTESVEELKKLHNKDTYSDTEDLYIDEPWIPQDEYEPIQLESDKRYWTRDGRKTSKVRDNETITAFVFICEIHPKNSYNCHDNEYFNEERFNRHTYRKDGTFYAIDGECKFDLVKEVKQVLKNKGL